MAGMLPVIFAVNVLPATSTETVLAGRSKRTRCFGQSVFGQLELRFLLFVHLFAGDDDAFATAVVEHELDQIVRGVGGPEDEEAVLVPAFAAGGS